MRLKKKDKILLQGTSGSGKTTLVKILLGLMLPDKANIYIDDKKIKNKDYKYFRKNISFVPQDVFIANLSFKENIALGVSEDDINMKKVIKCAKIAEIHGFINSNKNQYETITSHNARNISGGQKQRIGIARALYNDKQILVLDEATNAIDVKTEKKIFYNLLKFHSDKTILVISHKKIMANFFTKKYILKKNYLNQAGVHE